MGDYPSCESESVAFLSIHIQGVTPISLDEGRRREPAISLAVPATAPELQKYGTSNGIAASNKTWSEGDVFCLPSQREHKPVKSAASGELF